jgi:cyanophycin synthetase
MNFYNEHPFRVLLDYAHNAHGMSSMAQTVRDLTVHGRRIGVISAPGDRRDQDILDLARAAAPGFDLILLREDDNLRGRKRGEIGDLLRQGLVEAGFPEDRIAPQVYEEEDAVQRALETAQPGDLLVIFGDKLDRSWKQIVSFGRPAEAPVGSTPVAPIFAAGDKDFTPLPPTLAPEPMPSGRGARAGGHDD